MGRGTATLIMVLFLPAWTIQDATSHQHGDGKGQMKGMERTSMKDLPVVPCMQAIRRPHRAMPKGFKEGKIVVLQPENGAVIQSRNVKVVFDIPEKGNWGNHVHIYLDGRCRGMIRSGTTYSLGGLAEGRHKIELRLVSMAHHEYGPSASVEITIRLK